VDGGAQRKFLDLGGSAENQGDLRSVVLHKMTLGAQKSTFPIALGVRMTAVDDKAFSQTGESYSMITMPNADSHTGRVLQEDNTELAYEFARKFRTFQATRIAARHALLSQCTLSLQRATPRRTLTPRASTRCVSALTTGSTESCSRALARSQVAARRFCLVAADHPLVSAISENAEKLQCVSAHAPHPFHGPSSNSPLTPLAVLAQDGRDLGTLVALEPLTHLTRLLTPTPVLGR